jgi:hypothetical protein
MMRAFTAAEIIAGFDHVDRQEKAAADGNLHQLVMPNGKTLGECTCVEVGEFGEYFTDMQAIIDAVVGYYSRG